MPQMFPDFPMWVSHGQVMPMIQQWMENTLSSK